MHLRPVLKQALARFVNRVDVAAERLQVQEMGCRWGSAEDGGHLYFHYEL